MRKVISILMSLLMCFSLSVTASAQFSLEYTTPRGIDSTNYLCGMAGYNGAEVNGEWEP